MMHCNAGEEDRCGDQRRSTWSLRRAFWESSFLLFFSPPLFWLGRFNGESVKDFCVVLLRFVYSNFYCWWEERGGNH